MRLAKQHGNPRSHRGLTRRMRWCRLCNFVLKGDLPVFSFLGGSCFSWVVKFKENVPGGWEKEPWLGL